MFPFKIQTLTPDPDAYFGAALRAAHLAALRAVGNAWATTIIPKHFLTNAGATYRYQKRTNRYTRRKGRGRGPLVYTGDTKAAALTQQEIRPTPQRLRVILKLPDYIQTRRLRDPGPILESINDQLDKLRDQAATAAARGNIGAVARIQERITNLEANVKTLIQRGRLAQNYPPIKEELTRTLTTEYKELLAIYTTAGKQALTTARIRPSSDLAMA